MAAIHLLLLSYPGKQLTAVLHLYGNTGVTEGEMMIAESQTHRMFGVGRDLCGSSSPTHLSKQGHLQQAAQDLVQAGLEYLQRRRLHNLPGCSGLDASVGAILPCCTIF